jgi:hypothetical protein
VIVCVLGWGLALVVAFALGALLAAPVG